MSDVIIAGRNFANIGGGIDKGIIVMWSGTVDNIPEGWQLCDGTNDTPDLRDRFIVGAGSSYTTGDIGGADSVTLTTQQMPKHTHAITIEGTASELECKYSNKIGPYVYSANNSSSKIWGDASIEATAENKGGGAAHENRPPYYALCFIIKL